MPTVNITRGSRSVECFRDEVIPGQVFSIRGPETKEKEVYAAIGKNGRMYSVNVSSGKLSSSARGEKRVVLLGSFKFVLNKNPVPGVLRTCLRSEVQSGEVFTPSGKKTVYLHVGAVSKDQDGWLSIPYNNTENHAIGHNGNSRVDVIGSFTLEATMTN